MWRKITSSKEIIDLVETWTFKYIQTQNTPQNKSIRDEAGWKLKFFKVFFFVFFVFATQLFSCGSFLSYWLEQHCSLLWKWNVIVDVMRINWSEDFSCSWFIPVVLRLQIPVVAATSPHEEERKLKIQFIFNLAIWLKPPEDLLMDLAWKLKIQLNQFSKKKSQNWTRKPPRKDNIHLLHLIVQCTL